MIVHLGTELVMRLGVLDADGNVHPLKPRGGYTITRLDAVGFAQALDASIQAREGAAHDDDAQTILKSLAATGAPSPANPGAA